MEQLYNILSGVSHQSLQMAVNGLWAGLILTGLAYWALRYARATNAATRHLIWWSLLVVVVALPLLMGAAADRPSEAVRESAPAIAAASPVVAAASGEKRSAPVQISHRTQPNATKLRIENSERPEPAIPAPGKEASSALSILTGISPLLFFCIWICIVSLHGRRLVLSLKSMAGIKRRSRTLDISHLPRLQDVLRRAAGKRPIRVCSSDEVTYPMAAGFGKPIILIPEDLGGRMSDHELEAVILHELAHILRWDDWTKLGQKIVEAFLCFHPAVHWIGRQLDLERELACDDQVVVQTGKPGEYARCLTRLVQLTTGSATSLVPGALTSRKQIVKRFERLLLKNNDSGLRLSGRRLAAALVPVVMVMIGVVQLAPVVALPIDNLTYGELSEKLESLNVSDKPEGNLESVAVPSPLDGDADLWDEGDISIAFAGPVGLQSTELSEPEAEEFPAPENDLFIADVNRSLNDSDVLFVLEPETLTPPENDPFGADPGLTLDEGEQTIYGLLAYDDEASPVPSVPSVPAAPSVPPAPLSGTFTGFLYDDDGYDGTLISHGDGRTVTITWSDGSDKLSVSADGRIEFTDDDRDVKSISPGGYLSIEEKRGRKRRELEVESDADGKLDYGYYERGKAREFDAEARAWFGEVLLRAIRKTGLGAESRAARILKNDGVDGILREIKLTESDYVKRIYLDQLLAYGDLSESDHARIVRVISRDIDSDYEKAELLINVADRAQDDPELLSLLVRGAETIDSDYEVRRVLSELSLKGDVSDDVIETVLEIASRMDSDYERAELLIDMSDHINADKRFRNAYVLAVRDLDSDYESRRVLSAINLDRDLDDVAIDNILAIAVDMDSDYEKAELLIDLSHQCRGNNDHQRLLLRATSTLDSDYETRRVLESLPFDCQTTPELAKDVIMIAADIDSDYEKAELLSDLAECATVSEALAHTYLEAVSYIDSDYETKKVLQELISGADLKSDLIADILRVVEDFDSDYEKSEVLKELVDYCRGDDTLEDLFVDVIESMDSDYEIDKMYSLLYRRGRGSN